MKIGPADLEIICLKEFLNEGVHANDPLELQSYWTKVHQIYTQCSQIITDGHFKNQNGDIAIRFGMSGLPIKVNSLICQFLL